MSVRTPVPFPLVDDETETPVDASQQRPTQRPESLARERVPGAYPGGALQFQPRPATTGVVDYYGKGPWEPTRAKASTPEDEEAESEDALASAYWKATADAFQDVTRLVDATSEKIEKFVRELKKAV